MKGKIFYEQEVKAIIAGNKTQFREVIKVQPTNENQVFSTVASSIKNKDIGTHNFINPKATWEQTKKFKCPYKVQKIFCKETFCEVEVGAGMGYNSGKQTLYRAVDDYDVKWKPAQHMKQEHSRITLEITNIKVERLHDISYEDAIKEGVWNIQEKGSPRSWDVINAFRKSWNATHKKPEEKFDANPFVWVVDFKINK